MEHAAMAVFQGKTRDIQYTKCKSVVTIYAYTDGGTSILNVYSEYTKLLAYQLYAVCTMLVYTFYTDVLH